MYICMYVYMGCVYSSIGRYHNNTEPDFRKKTHFCEVCKNLVEEQLCTQLCCHVVSCEAEGGYYRVMEKLQVRVNGLFRLVSDTLTSSTCV